MDATVTAIMVRGVLATLLACGALICILRGSGLIADHFRTNERPTRFGFKIGEHELGFTTGAAGTAVVLTSAVWVLGTIWVTPSLRTAGGTQVADIPTGSAVITFQGNSTTPTKQQEEEGVIEGGPVGGGVDSPYRIGEGVTRPEIISSASPVYTEIARLHRVTGTVIVETVIDEQGNVTQARVLKGLPMGLDRAAVEAIRTWKFKPATLDGRPVKVYYILTVNFQINKDVSGHNPAFGKPGEDPEFDAPVMARG